MSSSEEQDLERIKKTPDEEANGNDKGDVDLLLRKIDLQIT